jgi:hypothetical protein
LPPASADSSVAGGRTKPDAVNADGIGITFGCSTDRTYGGPVRKPGTEDGFPDLYPIQIATWGKLGYPHTPGDEFD